MSEKVKVYADEGISVKNDKRLASVYREMLKDVKNGTINVTK